MITRLTTIILCLLLTFPVNAKLLDEDMGERLLRAAQAALDDPGADVRVKSWKAAQPSHLARAYRIEDLRLVDGSRGFGVVTARVWLEMPDRSTQAIFVSAQIEAKVAVWVTSRRIARGEPLDASNVKAEMRALNRIPKGALPGGESVGDRQASRNLSAGLVVTKMSAETPVLVRRGSSVAVRVQIGSIAVRSRGTALRSGRLGDSVRVRVDSSRRVLAGHVDGHDSVRITR